VVFDLDGTFLDTSFGIVKSVNLAFLKEGLPKLSFDEVIPYVGRGAKTLINSLFTKLQIEDSKLAERICQWFYEYYYLYCDENLHLKIDYPAIMEFKKKRKIYYALYSNKDERFTFKILNTLNLKFDEVLCPPAIPLKPDPAGIAHLISKYGFENKEVVLVGDSEVDYQTALQGGIDCILVTWGFTKRDILEKCNGCAIVDEPSMLFELL